MAEPGSRARNRPVKGRSKVLHQDQFESPVIGRARQSESQAAFQVQPCRMNVEHRERLVRLLRPGQKMADAAEVVVLLERQLEGLGHLHGNTGGGYEFQAGKSLV